MSCSCSRPPIFRLNTEGRNSNSISPTQHEALTSTLEEFFGTPDRPAIPRGVALNLDYLHNAAGPIGRDREMREHGLYRKHCANCHGIAGDGAGPFARLLDPYPRDFRKGVFKYTSTVLGAKPTREDLKKIVRQGMPGTGMPSYQELSEEDIESLVEYVKYLSIRGESELYLARLVLDENELLPVNKREILEDAVLPVAESWESPQIEPELWVVKPQRPPWNSQQLQSAINRGREIYREPRAQCVTCHGPEGRGDGEQTELYDVWNQAKKGVTDQQTRELGRDFALPLQKLYPRNFHAGIFHGGDTPEDIYLRIHIGIKGTPMPGAGPASGVPGVLTPDEIWDLTFYVLSLANKVPAPTAQQNVE
ncbi:MAG: c-type cytochrome [Thermogutta sp.]